MSISGQCRHWVGIIWKQAEHGRSGLSLGSVFSICGISASSNWSPLCCVRRGCNKEWYVMVLPTSWLMSSSPGSPPLAPAVLKPLLARFAPSSPAPTSTEVVIDMAKIPPPQGTAGGNDPPQGTAGGNDPPQGTADGKKSPPKPPSKVIFIHPSSSSQNTVT